MDIGRNRRARSTCAPYRGIRDLAVLAAVTAVSVALVSGCGAASSGTAGGVPVTPTAGGGVPSGSDSPVSGTPGQGQSSPPPLPTADAGTADLTITVNDGVGNTTTWHLTCGPAGGDHPHPEVACGVLGAKGAMALSPVPAGMMCTEIYGGPETARVVGTWNGKAVDAGLARTNGCEIARWSALAGLLPQGGI